MNHTYLFTLLFIILFTMDISGQLGQLLALLSGDPISSATLQSQLDVSQATVSRLLRRAGERVLRIGQGRATRYAATRQVLGESDWVQPIFRVEEFGRITQVATLRALVAGSYVVEPLGPRAKAPLWLLGDAGNGVFPSLPYFLFDLRPSGFLGRQIARRLARQGQTPPDPRDWTDEHIGAFLLHHGYDLPGALIVGEAAALRAQHHKPLIVNDRAETYPRLADAAIRDEAPGSSAAGEQPKFAIYARQAGHVIVKFSPSADSPEAQRWRDLLRAEAHALHVLDENGHHAATSKIFSFETRVFLESQRFDRDSPDGPDSPGGRHLAFSLAMVDAEFTGVGMGWGRVADALAARKLLAPRDRDDLVWAEVFGHWIGNSDMHLGNVSLIPRGSRFEVAPFYDMLPMRFAPIRGELPEVAFDTPLRTAANHAIWTAAGHAGITFWTRVDDDPEISAAFRALAQTQRRHARNALGISRG